jgi:voltage-gated potassium channel
MPTQPDTSAPRGSQAFLEKRAHRIASGRFVVVGVSTALVGVAIGAAVVMRIVDHHDFPSFGLALWWASETFTTVGYGDIVPTTTIGKFIGGGVMIMGITFLSFLTASVTSALIERDRRRAETAQQEADDEEVADVLAGIARLEERLERLEARLAADD